MDWVKNLQAAGHGVLHYNGCSIQVHSIRYVSYKDMKKVFPGMVRLFFEVLHVTDCLSVEK